MKITDNLTLCFIFGIAMGFALGVSIIVSPQPVIVYRDEQARTWNGDQWAFPKSRVVMHYKVSKDGITNKWYSTDFEEFSETQQKGIK